MGIIIYLIKVRPFSERVMNYLEMYNEVTLMATTIIMISFTDYSGKVETVKKEEEEMRSTMGWIFVGITALYILINLFFVLKGILQGLYKALKPCLDKIKE
jgi:hypothetical protein